MNELLFIRIRGAQVLFYRHAIINFMSFSAPIGEENLNIANKSLTTNKKVGRCMEGARAI